MNDHLDRFVTSHKQDYETALREIQSGRKQTHWMWYIFPQLTALGYSSTAKYYGIENLEEAKTFLANAYLGNHLREIASALLQLDTDNATLVMGSPDDMKLRSSMTLFHLASPEEEVFKLVLDKYFDGKPDNRTIDLLGT